MKKKQLILCLCLLMSTFAWSGNSQKNGSSDPEEAIVKELVAKKKDFIGKKIEAVCDFLVQKKSFIINSVTTTETSPWIPGTDGKIYVDEVVFFSKDDDQMHSGLTYYTINVVVKSPQVLDSEFWKDIPDDETWIEVFVNKAKNFIIKDIYCEKTTSSSHEIYE